MAVSVAQAARRALVRVLQALATVYSLALGLNREATDLEVTKAYKRVLLKAHPDKGGNTADAQKLQAAKEGWDKAKRSCPAGGRPKSGEKAAGQGGQRSGTAQAAAGAGAQELAADAGGRKCFRIRSTAVLLTYSGFTDLQQWSRFLAHVQSHLRTWKVKHWCATLEATQEDKLHVHMMVQFALAQEKVDLPLRQFCFEGLTPRADPTDLLGEGFCKKRMQESINRGMYYCFVDKIGTQVDAQGRACTAGNYEPCWTNARFKYAVKGRWPEALWKARKLSDEVYERDLFLTRDGVLPRKRNLDACRAKTEEDAQRAELQARVKRLRGNLELFQPFPEVPEAKEWLELFKQDRLRYPILVVRGRAATGKTEWAKSLFSHPLELKIGALEHFPEGMRAFTRGLHDGLILDDVRDLMFVVNNQEKLQGKYDALVEFASTPGGALSYSKDLFAVPTVVTVNYSTKHLDLLDTSDWLKLPENRLLLEFPPGQAGAHAGA